MPTLAWILRECDIISCMLPASLPLFSFSASVHDTSVDCHGARINWSTMFLSSQVGSWLVFCSPVYWNVNKNRARHEFSFKVVTGLGFDWFFSISVLCVMDAHLHNSLSTRHKSRRNCFFFICFMLCNCTWHCKAKTSQEEKIECKRNS